MYPDAPGASARNDAGSGNLYEWDEAKRLRNIEKHALDFLDVIELFERPYVDRPARTVGGELRRAATGPLDERFVTVVYVIREGVVRIISARRARNNEQDAYKALHDRGAPSQAGP